MAAAASPDAAHHLWRLAEVGALAALMGWLAERLFDTGAGRRGLSVAWGLAGVLVGGWLADLTDWRAGPSVAGCPVLPAFVGTLIVTALAKAVSLGLAGSR